MPDLTPTESATIAKHVYSVRAEEDMQTAAELSGGLGIRDKFSVAGSKRVSGTSGLLFLKKKSGFGYVAEGINNHQGETLIVLRGTKTARDFGTDANIGLQPGPGGWPVHAGFNDTFRSLRDEMMSFFAGRNPSTIHCVGHSLGGALATLAADFLSEHGVAAVKLYTFGCPRTGVPGFADHLSHKVGDQNIRRVYHDADIVPMLPIFPYAHVPLGGPDYRLDWSGWRVSVPSHFMESYIKTLGRSGDPGWASLRRTPLEPNWKESARSWLETSTSSGVIMFSAHVLWMITKALWWIIKSVLNVGLGTVLTAGATLLDGLAWMLHQGVLASKEVAGYVGSLMRRVMQFLGRVVTAGVNLTVAFIRWVLGLLFSALQSFATQALALIPFI